jgi:DNA-binding Lrp family transcriptional regulator
MRRKAIKPEHKIDLVLDELDRSILYHWDLNSRQSAAEIARKVGSNKDTVNFRMKRLVDEGIVTSFMTELDTSKFGYNNIKIYLQFRNITKELEKEMFDYLASIKEVGWIVSCSGRWDALFCYWAKSTYEFHKVFIKIMEKYGKHILNKQVIYNINWFYYNRKWLLSGQAEPLAIRYGGEPGKYKVDELDTKIIAKIVRDGRKPVVEIAKETGQASQNIINRMKKLEKDKVITKYSLNIDYSKIGYIFCKTFIYLENITQERLDSLYKYCAAHDDFRHMGH